MNADTNYDVLNFYKKVRKLKLEGFAITSSNTPKVLDKECISIGDGAYTVYKTDAHGYIVPGSIDDFTDIKLAFEELIQRLLTRKAMMNEAEKNLIGAK